MSEQVFGPDHYVTANSLNTLALILLEQGRYAEAGLINRRALTIYEQTLGPDHNLTATSLAALAVLHYYQGRPQEAKALIQRVQLIAQQPFGIQHPLTNRIIQRISQMAPGLMGEV